MLGSGGRMYHHHLENRTVSDESRIFHNLISGFWKQTDDDGRAQILQVISNHIVFDGYDDPNAVIIEHFVGEIRSNDDKVNKLIHRIRMFLALRR